MKGYRITLEGQTFEVEILSDLYEDQVEVRVNGKLYLVQVAILSDQAQETSAVSEQLVVPQPTTAPALSGHPAAINSQQLTAPLPGTVIRVSVQAGQQVQVGDELLVIEAMKMNNAIRSPRNGTVAKVLVKVGETVNHGGLLLSWAD